MNSEDRPYCLARNEQVILSSPGLSKERLRAGWKPGRFYLTNERFFLFQPPKIIFQVPYESIISITTERRPVVLRTKDVIFLTYRKPFVDRIAKMLHKVPESKQAEETVFKAWVAVGDVERWRKNIYERSLLRVDENGINTVMEQLDFESQEILYYLWENRHATIDELASLYKAPNHMDILFKIREVINPTAERLMGCSLLIFERTKKDDQTGKIVTYSWWIIGKKYPEQEIQKPMWDIFDEGNYLNIVMELANVKVNNEEDIKVEADGDRLSISTNSMANPYSDEIHLPCKVRPLSLRKRYNNNILEINVEKA